jgi:hypothetical protein
MRKKPSGNVKKVAFWLGAAAFVFGWAVWLTMKITMVNGQPAYDLSPPGYQPDKPPPPHQMVSIYARGLTDALAGQISVDYWSEHRGKDPGIKVWVPAGLEVRILVNNLKDFQSCSANTNPSASSGFGGILAGVGLVHIGMTKSSKIPQDPVMLTPAKSDRPYSLLCSLTRVASARTFTRQSLMFEYAADSDNPIEHALFPDLGETAGGFAPLPKEVVGFGGIDGADEFWFSGGYQDRRVSSFESSRELEPGQFVTATWSDLNREQVRDLDLVIIGTLIGIGVTMLIEAVRIILDTPDFFDELPVPLSEE